MDNSKKIYGYISLDGEKYAFYASNGQKYP